MISLLWFPKGRRTGELHWLIIVRVMKAGTGFLLGYFQVSSEKIKNRFFNKPKLEVQMHSNMFQWCTQWWVSSRQWALVCRTGLTPVRLPGFLDIQILWEVLGLGKLWLSQLNVSKALEDSYRIICLLSIQFAEGSSNHAGSSPPNIQRKWRWTNGSEKCACFCSCREVLSTLLVLTNFLLIPIYQNIY